MTIDILQNNNNQINVDVFVFDKNIYPLGIIEIYSSLRWLEKYNGVGEFELNLNVTEEIIELISIGNFIYKTNSKTCGMVEFIAIEGMEMVVRGKLLNGLLIDRIAEKTTNIKKVEADIRKMITDNCLTGSRAIPNLVLGPVRNITMTTDKQATYETIDTVLAGIDIGWNIDFDYLESKFVFNLYQSNNRSEDIMFSDDLDNLIDIYVAYDESTYKNVALVAGEGEGSKRITLWVDNIGTGEARKEMYVDARDLMKTYYDDSGTEVTISDTEYKNVLKERGLEKLKETSVIKTVEARIITDGNYVINEDFFLGDIVSLKSNKYQFLLDVRITEIQEVYDNSGVQYVATLENLGGNLWKNM